MLEVNLPGLRLKNPIIPLPDVSVSERNMPDFMIYHASEAS